MKRRIYSVGAALAVAPLAIGVTVAGAAGHKATIKPRPIAVKCATRVGVMLADGETQVVPPVQSGREYGSASCRTRLGDGVQSDTFTVQDSGTTAATFRMFFATGSVHGTYQLTPQEGSFGGATFTGATYTGTLTVAGGTGAFRGAKGTGTMQCTTADGVYTTCQDRVTLKQL